MPQQEVFLEQTIGKRTVEVLKTYDRTYAREVFGKMDAAAQTFLWNSLGISENYIATDLPAEDYAEREDFLWEELLEAAREDGNLLSFFVVIETEDSSSGSLYVSPDWPSAEAFAKRRISGFQ